jgi:cellulose synthase/poly-beta-1,6-N-acetylglucosamine synthase-like glycosyltransferase
MNDKELIFMMLFYAFVGVAFLQIFFYLFFYLRVVFFKKRVKSNKTQLPPISIIIAARNEANNLKENLSAFLEQDYPDFTVIVVNDASTDDSATVLAQFQQKYKNLYVTQIPFNQEFRHGKKTALTVGIKAAKTEILLFSDADCKPISKNWARTIVENFDDKTEFVIGFGGYEKHKGFLNKIIRADAVLIGMQYISFALAGLPYMAVGRNMAYKKSTFFKNKGFASHMKLLSGSDDLFVNQNANKNNLKVDISPESFTVSVPKKTFKLFIRQKIRHFTTGKFYKFKHKFWLFIEVFTRILTIWTAIVLLIFTEKWLLITSILFVRFFIFFITLLFVNKKFKQKNILFAEFLLDVFQPYFNFFLYLRANKKHELIWK